MRKLRQFEFVMEIARCGSVSKAARYLNLSQPTLSKYIGNLEEEIGLELFDRTTIPLKLTEAGRRYVVAGERILKTYSKLKDDLEIIKAGKTNTVRVGISPTRAHFILSKLIKNFKEINDKTKIVIKEDTVSALNESLYKGETDLIISLKSDETRCFDEVPLFKEKTLLAIPKEYENYSIEKILKECPFISSDSGNYLSDMLFNIMYEYGREDPVIEAQSIESVLVLVNDGIGAGFVPSYVRERCFYNNIVFKDIPDVIKTKNKIEDNRQVCVFFKQDKILNNVEKDLIQAAKNLK